MLERLASLPEELAIDTPDDADFAERDLLGDEAMEEGAIVIDAEGGFADESGGAEDGLLVAELVLEPEPPLAQGGGKESCGVWAVPGAPSQTGDEALVEEDREQTLVQPRRRHWHLTHSASGAVLEMRAEVVGETGFDYPPTHRIGLGEGSPRNERTIARR